MTAPANPGSEAGIMGKALTGCLIVVGLINIVPALGVVSADRLESAYAVTIAGQDLEILMRHRALLFGILGGFVLYSAFKPAYRSVAMVMAGVSMIGFALLVLSTGDYNPSIARVLYVDILGIVFLFVAVLITFMKSPPESPG